MSAIKMDLEQLTKKSEEVASLLKALSHPKRLLLLCHLSTEAHSVQELEKLCEISQSQVSQFLSKFELMGLVESKKDGRYIYYQLKDKNVEKLIQSLQKIYCSC